MTGCLEFLANTTINVVTQEDFIVPFIHNKDCQLKKAGLSFIKPTDKRDLCVNYGKIYWYFRVRPFTPFLEATQVRLVIVQGCAVSDLGGIWYWYYFLAAGLVVVLVVVAVLIICFVRKARHGVFPLRLSVRSSPTTVVANAQTSAFGLSEETVDQEQQRS